MSLPLRRVGAPLSALRARLGLGLMLGLVAGGSSGCEVLRNLVAPETVTSATFDPSIEVAFCVDEINRLRAAAGAPPLA